MSLVETQRRIRRAVVDADSGATLSMLVGGPRPADTACHSSAAL